MNKYCSTFLLLFWGFCLLGEPSLPQNNVKIARYLKVLVRKPNSTYVFDRFYNSWMEHSGPEELIQYLKDEYQKNSDATYLLLLAFSCEKEGNSNKAIQFYNQYLAKKPDSPQILFTKAKLEFRNHNYLDTIHDLQKALKCDLEDPLEFKIRKMLGKAYIRNEQHKQGFKIWKELGKTVNDDTDLAEEIMELQLAEGEYNDAITTCRELIKKTTNKYRKVTLSLRLGDIYRRKGERQKAVETYSEILRKVGNDSWLEKEILSQVEQVFRSEDDSKGLLEYYDKQIKTEQKRLELLKRYSFLLNENGKTDQALEVFQKTGTLNPLEP